MSKEIPMQIIAHIYNDFTSKFGIPRQSGIVDSLTSVIILEPEFRNSEVYRGLEGYSHAWLIWQFSQIENKTWSPTVRPPKLGGNTRVGVFASRSPFRPNNIGLSSVRIKKVDLHTDQGPLLYVTGADLMDGTPLFDIKPYLPYTDAHPDASGGYAVLPDSIGLKVSFPKELLTKIPEESRNGLLELLKQDPRPGYQRDPERIYGLSFSSFEIRFVVKGDSLTVVEVKGVS